MSTSFAARLNQLFALLYPLGGKPHTRIELVAACQAAGVSVSAPYLSQLCLGRRTNPSKATMTAIADFFRVDVRYFTDDAYYQRLSQELKLLAELRDDGVRRIASRVVGLSPQAVQDLVDRAEELRRGEHAGTP